MALTRLMARFATLALLGLLLVACGSASRPGAAASPPPIAGSPAGGQLGDADAGKTVALHPGDTVEVALHAPAGYSMWSAITSSNRAVLTPVVDTRATAPLGVTVAKFKAVAAGTAELSASSSPECSPGAACPAIARLWRVSVQVG